MLDKIQALYQGRPPRLRDADSDVPLVLLDDFDELEAFQPYGLAFSNDEYGATAHSVSTFKQFCKLSIIIEHILYGLYTGKSRQKSPQELHQTLKHLAADLKRWQDSLPDHLSFCFDNSGNLNTSNGYVALPHTLCLGSASLKCGL